MIERSREWTEADLQQLIANEVEESTSLEYKRAASLGKDNDRKNEIFKDVSAFANSAGGVLVYGVAEADGKPSHIDPVDPNVYGKEWLEDIITSNVQPRIDGLHINPVPLAGANAGRVVYVLTISQGLTAHQARDKKYYKRFNFKAEAMEHYEVQDTMNRAKTPIIYVHIERQVVSRTPHLHRYRLIFFLENKGTRAAQHMKFVFWFPEELAPSVSGFHQGPVERKEILSGKPYQAREYLYPFSNSVLFPMDTLDLYRMGYSIDFKIDSAGHEFVQRFHPRLMWTVFADDMLPRSGYEPLRDFDEF